MANLDPSIWSGLSTDILLNIISQSDTVSQKQWAHVSRICRSHAYGEIWRTVRISGPSIDNYTSHSVDGQTDAQQRNVWAGVVGLLIHAPSRYNAYPDITVPRNDSLPLPSSYVKGLEINNFWHSCQPDALKYCLPSLLEQLPRLERLSYDGVLLPGTLHEMVLVGGLKTLILRINSLAHDMSHGPLPTGFPTGIWDEPLDFGMLMGLSNLQSLVVGRLSGPEAQTLASVVPALRLTDCHISSTGWVANNGGRRSIAVSRTSPSPVTTFLDCLSTKGGFPSTLLRLRLDEMYRTTIFSLFQLVASTIQPCGDLTALKVTFVSDIVTWKILNTMGLRPSPRVIGLQDWQDLLRDEVLNVRTYYRSLSGELRCTEPLPGPANGPVKSLARTVDDMIAAQHRFWATPRAHQAGPRELIATLHFSRNVGLAKHSLTVYPGEDNRGFESALEADRHH